MSNYWTLRNALVDAVRAARASGPSVTEGLEAFSRWCRSDAGKAYYEALDALKAFDTKHRGSPIL